MGNRINAHTPNIGLAKAGQTEVIEHLHFYQHLCLTLADNFQISCLRQAVNRQAVKKPQKVFVIWNKFHIYAR